MYALATESWSWYGVTWIVVLARVASRRLLLGSFKKMQIDDALMMGAMVADTVLMVAMNIVADSSSNLIDPNDTTELTPENIASRVYGSKMVLVVEQMQCAVIWLVKACLLIMYGRLTMNLGQRVAVKVVAGYVALGFVVMEILYLGVWCRPFEQYWAVPPDNVQCSAATNHLITNMVLNLSSDVMIMLIPMPVLLQSQLPLKKKLILAAIFALGSFTILSAILSKYYSFTEPFGSSWTFWYIRESSTALLTANLPFTWTLLRRTFNLKSFNGGKSSTNRRTGETTSRFRATGYGNRLNSRIPDDVEDSGAEFERSDSQEQINKTYMMPLKIYRHQEVHVGTEEVSPDGRTTPEPTAGAPRGKTSPPKLAFLDSKNTSKTEPDSAGTVGVVTTCRGAT